MRIFDLQLIILFIKSKCDDNLVYVSKGTGWVVYADVGWVSESEKVQKYAEVIK